MEFEERRPRKDFEEKCTAQIQEIAGLIGPWPSLTESNSCRWTKGEWKVRCVKKFVVSKSSLTCRIIYWEKCAFDFKWQKANNQRQPCPTFSAEDFIGRFNWCDRANKPQFIFPDETENIFLDFWVPDLSSFLRLLEFYSPKRCIVVNVKVNSNCKRWR